MKNPVLSFLILLPAALSLSFIQSCNEDAGAKESSNTTITKPATESFPLSEEFKRYWYAGKAELCSYHLKQARYGEIHEGYAVTIFVTEDFSKSKQVKLDQPEAAGDDRLPVLKLNLVKKFNTGIYTYSMMMSVFSPVDINNYPDAVKVTANVQEWCGSSFTQINRRDNKYHVAWNSYFEQEGDHDAKFESCIPEDELWNLIRLEPDRLPIGEKKLLPGSFYSRMTHIPFAVQTASLSLTKEGNISSYKIDYLTQQHTINIRFENSFPFKIVGWDETFPGFDGKLLTTTAALNKTILSDYWMHHNNNDRALRKELGLPEDN